MNELNGKYCYIFNYLVLFYSLVNSLGEQKLPNLNEKAVLEVEEKINNLLNNQEYLEIPLIALDPHTVRGRRYLAISDLISILLWKVLI